MTRIITLTACAAIAACTTMTPAQQAETQRQAARPVTCTVADCEVKWGRALQWVLNNSAYKIQNQSESLLTTMGPLPDDPRPAFTISKIAQGDGRYVIDFRAGCDNMFGCVPTLVESRASFVQAVMGP